MRKHWGWGDVDRSLSTDQIRQAAPASWSTSASAASSLKPAVPLEAASLPTPRLGAGQLGELADVSDHARATHALGKAYRDIIRGFPRRFRQCSGYRRVPHREADVERILEWCWHRNVAVIPYGGGTSVVGGVEGRDLDRFEAVLSWTCAGWTMS